MPITNKSYFSKKILPIMLSAVVLLTSFGAFAGTAYASANSITVSYSHGKAYISGVSNSVFSATDSDGSSGIAYCMDKGQRYTSGNKVFSNPKECPADLNYIMNMGYPNTSASKLANLAGVSSLTKDQARAATQMALWSCGYGNDIKINSRSAGTASGGAKVLKAAKWLYNNRNDDQAGFLTFYYYSNGTSGHQRFLYSVGDETNTLTFMKISAAPKITEKNSYYGDLTDARFKLYEGSEANGTAVDTLKVKKGTLADVFDVDDDMELSDADIDNTTEKLLKKAGITSMSDTIYYTDIEDEDLKGSHEFESGQKYTIVETTVPTGFKKSKNLVFTLDKGNNIQILANEPIIGQIKLNKTSGNTLISNDNSCYSLAGAVYEVKGANTFNSDVVRTITTDANGKAETPADLPLGKYVVKEIKPSPGYAIDLTPHDVTLTANDAVDDVAIKTVSSVEIPQNDPVTIMLQKNDSELKQNTAQGDASLSGAEYTVKYYDGQYSSVSAAESSGKLKRTWVFKTDPDGFINIQDPEYFVSGDKLYYDTRDRVTFPLGTVLIQETKTPEGYLIDKTIHLRNITSGGKTVEPVETFVSPTSIEVVYRGDLELVKISEKDHERLANVPFKLTSKTTGETHTIVTDKNGYASTNADWNPHDQNTNKGQSSEDGIWFSLNHDGNGKYFSESAPDNSRGALIYDTYIIEEQKCESNKDKELIPAFEVSIYKNNNLVKLGTLSNEKAKLPEIGTKAKDVESGGQTLVSDPEAKIIDTVSYKNLKIGETYSLTGKLMNKKTGEPLLVGGKEVTASAVLTPEAINGTVDVEFTFNATSLGGIDLVVFEYLYLDADLIAKHTDINDEGQTIKITEPKIGTTATNKKDGSKELDAKEKVTILDTVKYTNLIPGKTYTMKGILMDKVTGKPLLIDKKEVTAEKEFTPDKADGTVELEFTFDASALAGKEIVVFENLFRNDSLITSHADIADKDQTVKVKTPAPGKEKSDTPTGSSSQTGDKFNIWLAVALALSAIGALVTKIIISRKSIS